MIIAPIVFTTLAVGVAKIEDGKAIGRIGAKTLAWFSVGSFISLLLGMALVNIFQPGAAMHLAIPDVAIGTVPATRQGHPKRFSVSHVPHQHLRRPRAE